MLVLDVDRSNFCRSATLLVNRTIKLAQVRPIVGHGTSGFSTHGRALGGERARGGAVQMSVLLLNLSFLSFPLHPVGSHTKCFVTSRWLPHEMYRYIPLAPTRSVTLRRPADTTSPVVGQQTNHVRHPRKHTPDLSPG
jgi:hypothetical protein